MVLYGVLPKYFLIIPMNIVRQWELKEGDKLDWSWDEIGEELLIVVKKMGYDHTRNTVRYDHQAAYQNELRNQSLGRQNLTKPEERITIYGKMIKFNFIILRKINIPYRLLRIVINAEFQN